MDSSEKKYIFLGVSALAIVLAFFIAPNRGIEPNDNEGNLTEFSTTTLYTVTGHYAPYEKKMEYDGEFFGTTTCDAFVAAKSQNDLVVYLQKIVLEGNTINSLTSEGNLRMNIDLTNLGNGLVAQIKKSTAQNPVSVQMRMRELEGKENIRCGSFVEIVDAK